MKSLELLKLLKKHTITYSNFEPKRSYISLSHIAMSEDDIIKSYLIGFEDNEAIRLKCYKGYQMDKDLKNRLKSILGDSVTFDQEINVKLYPFTNRINILGHPDFVINKSIVGDIKSVALDDWFPKPGKLPVKIYWQIQAYMKYGNFSVGYIIYESRETGNLKIFEIYPNPSIQKRIDDKLKSIIRQLESLNE